MNDSNQPSARDVPDVRPFADRVGEAVRGGGFWMDGYWVWCGSVAKGEDGRYHMFAARWPKDYPFFQGYTAHSEIVRAVADTPEGPFTFEEVVFETRDPSYWDGKMTHNPYLMRGTDGWYLFYCGVTYEGEASAEWMWELNRTGGGHGHAPPWMNDMRSGVAFAETLTGPWQRPDQPLDLAALSKTGGERAVNVCAALTPEGRCRIIYRLTGSGLITAVADHPAGPYPADEMHLIHDYGKQTFIEDPCIFRCEGCYQMLSKDASGDLTGEVFALAHYLSTDGVHWQLGSTPKACSRHVRWDDGVVREQGNLERPFVLLEGGRPTHLYAATSNGTHEAGQHPFQTAEQTWCMAIRLKP